MIISMCTVSDSNIDLLLNYPPFIGKVVCSDDLMFYEELVKGASDKPKADLIMSKEKGEGGYFDLDKSWHALHFMFTKTPWGGNFPENFLLLGGDKVGKIEVGYGPARALNSKMIAEINDTLNKLSTDDFMIRYNPGELTKVEVYPEIWNRPEEDRENREYIRENFEGMKKFIQNAAEKQLGLVIWMS